jgi:methionine sulfoxide reductase heme-binding subunit
MAATSHDFWLAQLTAPVWKALHMGVYAAYALVVAHVASARSRTSAHRCSLAVLGARRWWASWRSTSRRRRGSARVDRELDHARAEGSSRSGGWRRSRRARGKVVTLAGERVAVFRYDGKISARLERLPPPERPARRGEDPRRLRHLPLARLPVPPR